MYYIFIYLLFFSVAQKQVSFHRLSTTKRMVVPRPSYIPCSNFQTAIGFIFNVTFWFAKVRDMMVMTFFCRIVTYVHSYAKKKKLLMYRKILFAIFEMIHSFMTMNLCNNFSVGTQSGQKLGKI